MIATTYTTTNIYNSAVHIAYEARKQFRNEKIWITNEIIHNPTVNKSLEETKVENIPVDGAKKHFEVVKHGDVVILPVFGVVVDEMLTLSDKNVWNTNEKHKKGEYTSIIHGKYAHEETITTASFTGKYIIVKDMKEEGEATIEEAKKSNHVMRKLDKRQQTRKLDSRIEEQFDSGHLLAYMKKIKRKGQGSWCCLSFID
ncbi:hypothetical protein K2173_014451 [Erythroxylum novogranatense]|uniref:4-hydroxy-3-methylbut-2-enyl diphosphate reductase n=1 Tax=Erythroxylum novogranatense TaxID=1862640 RepID=A0AAV8S4N1_9ROSI|nr:hypothetical protein K2173_014451 [Erythroxylum novogranatense]